MSAIATSSKTILLVEDNPDDEALAIRALKRHHIGIVIFQTL